MMSAAFDWHNYGKSTIGNRTDIERVPIDESAGVLSQVLPARQRRAGRRRQVRRDEGAGARRANTSARCPSRTRKLDKTYTEEPPQDGERTVMLRRVGDVAAWSARPTTFPPGSHADVAALEVLAQCSTTHPSGPALQGPGRNQARPPASSAAPPNWHDPGVFEITAGRAPRRRRSTTVRDMHDRRHREDRPERRSTEEEVDRAKLQASQTARAARLPTPAASPWN